MGQAVSLLLEFSRAVVALPALEFNRRRRSLHSAIAEARRVRSGRRARSAVERVILRRAIALLDRCLPGGPNCVRRALLEVRLDEGAARERFFAGFRAGGGDKSGHAWLESHPTRQQFDAVVAI